VEDIGKFAALPDGLRAGSGYFRDPPPAIPIRKDNSSSTPVDTPVERRLNWTTLVWTVTKTLATLTAYGQHAPKVSGHKSVMLSGEQPSAAQKP
jgi:hypothetical protein